MRSPFFDKNVRKTDFVHMVESGGIEPPSESASSGTSPGAESPFYSLPRAWTLTLTGSVASLCMVRSKLCALTFAADRRLASGPRPSRRRRSLLRQREEQSYCCSLIYNCPFLGCQAHPPAIPVSTPPSKPVRPLIAAARPAGRAGSAQNFFGSGYSTPKVSAVTFFSFCSVFGRSL